MRSPEIEEAERIGFVKGVQAALRTLENPVYESSPALLAAIKRVRGVMESKVRHMQKREENPKRRTRP